MPASFMVYITLVLSWVQWLFEKGLAGFTLAWNTSRKATEVAIVGLFVFAVVVWLGFAHAPKVPAEDADLAKEVSALSAQVAKLSVPSCPVASPVTTGSIVKKSKK